MPGFRDVEAALAEQPDTLPDDRAAGAAMHYTSGTTGKPKGVKRKLNDFDPDVMAELFTGFFSLFGIPHREDQVHLCTSPNYHTAVTTFAGNALNSGHRVVFMDKWDPEETLAKIERYSVTHTHMVPTQFHRMLQLPDDVKSKYDVSSMRWAIHAAAPCPIDVKQKMLDWWGPVIWEYYGATEGGGTTATPEDWLKYPGTVGSPWAISELKITDDDGTVVDAGVPGTVWMKMGGQDFEYKGDKSKTDENHDADGFFTVGDIGYLNEDGFLFLCDRKSDMIIAGGVNIYPAEIEGEILAHPRRRRRRRVRHPRRRHGRADQGRGRAGARRTRPATSCAASIMEPPRRAGWPSSSGPSRSTSSTSSPASPPASSSSASSATPTGKAATAPI